MDQLKHRLRQKEPHIITLIIMSSFASMGAVIFTPALPQIANYFAIPISQSQLTITLFLVGYAMGQLIYAPLANRFGRKPAFYIGIVIASLGSIVSILSEPFHSFTFLILGRMLEALGSSAGLVLAFTIVNDFYFPEQARKVIALMMLAFAIIPGIATLIGGVLVTHFGWITCFYFLLVYGWLLAIPVCRLDETALKLDPHALKTKHLSHNYRIAFENPLVLTGALMFGFVAMNFYAFYAASPLIAIDRLGMSAEQFGFIGFIPFLGTAAGSILSARLSNRLDSMSLIKLGYLIETIAGVILAACFYGGLVNMVVLMGCGFFFMLGGCIVMSNASVLATSKSEDRANASAVMNFITITMATLGTLILALLPGEQTFKLATMWIIGALLMYVFLRKLKRLI